MSSRTPDFRISDMNFEDKSHLEPKSSTLVVSFSLVYESNDGFTIEQFTKSFM